ncbi:unnamed protein product [marine sediment metagenome]|uniref:Leucine-binding protein domain-containing protein n=1 Tax=marine sediment metagenome TaxID=412755 RepID=X1LR08_9ZZZZ
MVTGEIIPCLVDIGKRFGVDRLFIMIQDVAHARGGGGLIAKIMAEKGWHVIGKPEIYPTGTTDFSMGLIKAKREKAQVILIWMDMPETSILLKQWYDMKIPALPFGSIIAAAEQPGFWKATEGKGEYCLANVVNAGNAPSEATPWTMKFVKAYKKRWNIEPEGYGTSTSYMAPYVLKDASIEPFLSTLLIIHFLDPFFQFLLLAKETRGSQDKGEDNGQQSHHHLIV